MRNLLCPLAVLTLLLVGCHDDLAGPDVAGTTVEARTPTPAQLSRGPLVQLHLSPTTLPSGDYTLRVAGVLNGFAKTGGSASLWDSDDPSRRYHYKFQEGEVDCQGGTVVVLFSGEGFMTSNAGGQQGDRHRGEFKHDFFFTIPTSLDPLPTQGAPSRQGFVTLVAGEPLELVGETFSIEFDRVYFSPDICGIQ